MLTLGQGSNRWQLPIPWCRTAPRPENKTLCLIKLTLHKETVPSLGREIKLVLLRWWTWTLSSDSDLLSDVSVETARHPGYWLILITVECVKTLALIKYGASVSMMGRLLYQKVSQMRLQMHKMLLLEGVGATQCRLWDMPR